MHGSILPVTIPPGNVHQHFSGVGNFIECQLTGVACGGKGGNILNVHMQGALYRPSLQTRRKMGEMFPAKTAIVLKDGIRIL